MEGRLGHFFDDETSDEFVVFSKRTLLDQTLVVFRGPALHPVAHFGDFENGSAHSA